MSEDDLDLSLETLDEWESELDQFAVGVSRRLSQLSGHALSSLTVDKSDDTSSEVLEGLGDVDDPDTQNLIQSIRELRQ